MAGHRYHYCKMVNIRRIALVLISSLSTAAAAEDCFDAAARYHSVNANILRAIAIKESTNCSSPVTRNTNNTTDVGCMGINSIHFEELAQFGISPRHLLDPCNNIFVGAWHYRKKVRKHGNNWTAVGAYHSETPQFRDIYSRAVYQIWIRYGLDKLP